jgi:ATP-dependent Clp endopeptidase proteolytic subunit ClpP
MKKYYEIKAMGESTGEVYIFGSIGKSYWDDDAVGALDFISELKALGNVSQIDLHINSEGGSVFEGNAIFNALANHTAKVTAYVEGLAASMASVIVMAADNVVMNENSMLMIHDPWAGAVGNSKELRKQADALDKAKDTMISSYRKKSGLDEDQISAIMTEETWFSASEAVELGFADEIIEPLEMAACLNKVDLSRFAKVPALLTCATKEVLQQKPVNSGGTIGEKIMPKGNLNAADADKIDVEAIKAKAATDALAIEAKRQGSIRNIFGYFQGQDELMSECLSDQSVTASGAQTKLLAALGAGVEPLGHDTRATTTEDHSDKFKTGFASAILARAGVAKDDERNEFRGLSLVEGARKSLEARGVSTGHMDKLAMVGAAFTHSSSDYGTLLENIANKSMLKGFDESEETFQEWTTRGVLTDFKATKRVDLNTFPDLLEVPEGSEYKYGTMGDRGETVQLATYGRRFGITRQAIINDDLSAFTRIPQKMGRAAPRTIGTLVYAILSGNPNMSDGVALFHGDHGNLGSAGVISTASVDALRVLMAVQKDPDSNATALNIRPAHLIVPVQLEGLAKTVLESETEIAASQNNSKRPNSVRGIANVISDARLTGTSWFMTGSSAMHDTVEVSYLDGNDKPYLEQQNGWNIDGVEFKVRLDAGVKALDFRALAKNAGA